MSSLHTTEDGRHMLDLVDKLRSLGNLEKTIPLPQIVVVGQQSCGKSSVLHAISGIRFPSQEGLCTQFPIEIVLRRENTISAKASIKPNAVISEEEKQRFQDFGDEWRKASLDDLFEIITSAKKAFKIHDTKRFSYHSLVLEVCGPDQEHLTLIDLPGYISSPGTDQDEGDPELIKKLAESYINKDRAIVLAVVTCKYDFENQVLPRILRDSNLSKRTLGILTAPECMKKAPRRLEDSMKYLEQDSLKLSYGWHVLRNLDQQEIAEGQVRDEVEQCFFKQHAPWNGLNPMKLGSHNLRKRLSSLLKKCIADSMPAIRSDIDSRIQQIKAGLAELGEARSSPREIRGYLCDIVRAFEEAAVVMMNGFDSEHQSFELIKENKEEEVSLRAFLNGEYQSFASEMLEKARLWQISDKGDEEPEHLAKIFEGRVSGTSIVSCQAMVSLFEEQVRKGRGKELPNLVHGDWSSKLFRRQSQRWGSISQSYCDRIYQEVAGRIVQIVWEIAENEVATRLIQSIVLDALAKRKSSLDAKLKELYKPYQSSGIHCFSKHYEPILLGKGTPQSVDLTSQCANILRSTETYYDIASEIYIDNIINLGVENCLLENLKGILNQKAMCMMSDDELEELAGESPEVKERRSKLLGELAEFEQARDYIIPSLGSACWRTPKKSQIPEIQSIDPGFGGMLNTSAQPEAKDSQQPIEVTQLAPPATPIRIRRVVRGASSPSDASPTPSNGNAETASPSVASDASSPSHVRSVSSVSSFQGSPLRQLFKSTDPNTSPTAPDRGLN